jgi:hypothetical protein
MLSRLYFEYQFLCGFVHFSTQPTSFKGIFDQREPFGQLFTAEQLDSMFQKEIAGPTIWIDFLSIVQSAAEIVALYPADVELRRAVTDGWAVLSERTIMGRAVWEFRAKKLLDKGLVLLSIDNDEAAETANRFLAKRKMTWPNFHLTSDVAAAFPEHGIPYYVLADASGKVVYTYEGFDEASLRAAIAKLDPKFAFLSNTSEP